MSARAAWSLFVPGEPRGMPRARVSRAGFRYHDKAQEQYADEIGDHWLAAGRPVLVPGPYQLHVWARMKRPDNHLRRDGTLTPKGEREPLPMRVPDGDNLLKQIDVLVALKAVPDDAHAAKMSVSKEWARPGYPLGLTFVLRTLSVARQETLDDLLPDRPGTALGERLR